MERSDTSTPLGLGLGSINFHHLRYFWLVARSGNLTRVAKELRVSQSALSSQIRLLETSLDTQLFVRANRKLELTESGHLALRVAEEIFTRGDELVQTIVQGRGRGSLLNVGAVATLSRNFQESFLSSFVREPHGRLRIASGRLTDLLAQLERHELDVVLSNRIPEDKNARPWQSQRIARQQLCVVGRPEKNAGRFVLERELSQKPLLLPGPENSFVSEFRALCKRKGIAIRVLAEVDDMAMMRLLARDVDALAILPAVVVRDELRRGELTKLATIPGVYETFYAITAERSYQHPALESLLRQAESTLLNTVARARTRRASRASSS